MAILKDSTFWGAISAAVATVVLGTLATYIIAPKDVSPPDKPTILAVERLVGEIPTTFELRYQGAQDEDGGSGLKDVRLWMRHADDFDWIDTGHSSTGVSGSIRFPAPDKQGQYFLDIVARDQSDNETALPHHTKGQLSYIFVAPKTRKPDVVRPTPAPAIAKPLPVPLPPQDPPQDFANLPWITVPTTFHLIEDTLADPVELATLHEQIKVLNEAFFDGRISFLLDDVTRTEKREWRQLKRLSAQEREMKHSLSVDTWKNLNVYVTTVEGGLLEWGTFPYELQDRPKRDGCVLNPNTLPGGVAPFDEGKSLVHCVGHWFGLFHTFQDGCEGPGDLVDDTPAHAGPNFGAPTQDEPQNLCPGETGPAPVFNFMNYVDDRNMKEFTPGQLARMRAQANTFRPGLPRLQ